MTRTLLPTRQAGIQGREDVAQHIFGAATLERRTGPVLAGGSFYLDFFITCDSPSRTTDG